jgi:hypothetical protein
MPAPRDIFDELACFNAVKQFVLACCPEVKPAAIYRSHPGATPSSQQVSIVMVPLNGGPPIRQSPMGEGNISKQQQKVQVLIQGAAVGTWRVNVLGQTASYVAGGGDTSITIRNGLKTALDLLGLPLTTSTVTVGNAPGVQILADVAGVSMTVNQLTNGDIPAGGVSSIVVVDDNLVRAYYNWGIWTIRMIFRDPPSAEGPVIGQGPLVRVLASTLAERVRSWMEAGQDLPVVNGSAYPYRWDLLGAAPARLGWRQTQGPFAVPEELDGVWTRGVALDMSFDVPCGLIADIPSMDTILAPTLTVTG